VGWAEIKCAPLVRGQHPSAPTSPPSGSSNAEALSCSHSWAALQLPLRGALSFKTHSKIAEPAFRDPGNFPAILSHFVDAQLPTESLPLSWVWWPCLHSQHSGGWHRKILSSRPAWATQWDNVSKTNKKRSPLPPNLFHSYKKPFHSDE
jgi:hypothetical protein